jgi:hypothetical protein
MAFFVEGFVDENVSTVGWGQTALEARKDLLKFGAQAAKVEPKSKQHAWFVWARRNGKLSCHSYIVEGDRIHADSKKYYESFELKKFPLTEEEWNLPLSDLILRYPLPPEFVSPAKREAVSNYAQHLAEGKGGDLQVSESKV